MLLFIAPYFVQEYLGVFTSFFISPNTPSQSLTSLERPDFSSGVFSYTSALVDVEPINTCHSQYHRRDQGCVVLEVVCFWTVYLQMQGFQENSLRYSIVRPVVLALKVGSL